MSGTNNNQWTAFGADDTNPFNDLEFTSKLKVQTAKYASSSSSNPFDEDFFNGEDMLSPTFSKNKYEAPGNFFCHVFVQCEVHHNLTLTEFFFIYIIIRHPGNSSPRRQFQDK